MMLCTYIQLKQAHNKFKFAIVYRDIVISFDVQKCTVHRIEVAHLNSLETMSSQWKIFLVLSSSQLQSQLEYHEQTHQD